MLRNQSPGYTNRLTTVCRFHFSFLASFWLKHHAIEKSHFNGEHSSIKVLSVAFSLLTWLKVFMSICSHAFISGCVILLETVSIVFKQGVSLFSHLSSHTFRGSRSVRVRDVSSSFLKWQVSPGRQNARVLPAHTGGLVQGPPVSYSSWDGSSGCHHPIYSFCACLSDKFSWWNTVLSL